MDILTRVIIFIVVPALLSALVATIHYNDSDRRNRL